MFCFSPYFISTYHSRGRQIKPGNAVISPKILLPRPPARQGLIPNLILTSHQSHPTHNPTISWLADTTKKVANSRSPPFSSVDRIKLLTDSRQSSTRTPHSLNTPVSLPPPLREFHQLLTPHPHRTERKPLQVL